MKLRTHGLFSGLVVMATMILGFGTGAAASMSPAASTSQATSTSTIVSIATANLGHRACDTTTSGEIGYYSSCTGANGSPEDWCADFAKWVWAQAGFDVAGLTPAAGSFALYHQGMKSTPQVGDAVIFNYWGGGEADHVAIVTAVHADGTIESIGGNEGDNNAATATVNHDGPYNAAVGSPLGATLKISGYVSPVAADGPSTGNSGATITGVSPCDPASYADCSAPAAGDGSDCHPGHFCLYTGQNYTGTIYALYNCQTDNTDWLLQNWNGVGSYINANTDNADSYLKNQDRTTRTTIPPTGPSSRNTYYDFTPIWFVQAC